MPVSKKAPQKVTASRPSTRTTRAATSKTTRKKTAPKATAKVRALVCAPDEKCFWTTDGRVLKDLEQLHLAFGSMNDEVFLHHVTKEKNDFADWVEIVLEDAACAADLRRSRKTTTAKTTVARHLKQYARNK